MKITKGIGIAMAIVLMVLAYREVAHWDGMFTAVRAGDVDKIEMLLAANPRLVNARDFFGMKPLQWAAYKNRKNVAELLLARGADVNANVDGDDYMTALHWAIKNNNKDMVSLLLANGADPNIMKGNGQTPLQMAKGNKSIAEILRQHGAKE